MLGNPRSMRRRGPGPRERGGVSRSCIQMACNELNVDPWVGATIMADLLTPEFMKMSDPTATPCTICTTNPTLGTDSSIANIFGLPMQLNRDDGLMFVTLMMVAVLAVLYKLLTRASGEHPGSFWFFAPC